MRFYDRQHELEMLEINNISACLFEVAKRKNGCRMIRKTRINRFSDEITTIFASSSKKKCDEQSVCKDRVSFR